MDVHGGQHEAFSEPIPDRRRYSPLNLETPIVFAQPRSGWIEARVDQDRYRLGASSAVVTITDGIGAATTASTAISD